MRKMKKINGYLIVQFSDREKRLNDGTGLGSFGVIDAEQYTGILDIDRDAMEYDSAETLEEAIEQARGLESELEVTEPEVKITIVTETETDTTEEEVDPFALFQRESNLIHNQAVNPNWPYIDEYTAPYHLRGYVSALEDLNLIDLGDERFQIEMEERGDRTPLMMTPEEVKEFRQFKDLLKEISDYVDNTPDAAPQEARSTPITLHPAQKTYLENKVAERMAFAIYKAILKCTKVKMSQKRKLELLESLRDEILTESKAMARAHYNALNRILITLSAGMPL